MNNAGGWNWYYEAIKAETLWTAAHKAGDTNRRDLLAGDRGGADRLQRAAVLAAAKRRGPAAPARGVVAARLRRGAGGARHVPGGAARRSVPRRRRGVPAPREEAGDGVPVLRRSRLHRARLRSGDAGGLRDARGDRRAARQAGRGDPRGAHLRHDDVPGGVGSRVPSGLHRGAPGGVLRARGAHQAGRRGQGGRLASGGSFPRAARAASCCATRRIRRWSPGSTRS